MFRSWRTASHIDCATVGSKLSTNVLKRMREAGKVAYRLASAEMQVERQDARHTFAELVRLLCRNLRTHPFDLNQSL